MLYIIVLIIKYNYKKKNKIIIKEFCALKTMRMSIQSTLKNDVKQINKII